MQFMSHVGQDSWVAEVLMFRKGGYFLDFGTFDGLITSNTFALEKYLGWRGICVEPNPTFFAAACAVRSSIMVNAALWPQSRQSLAFRDAHGLSALEPFAGDDSNSDLRQRATRRSIMVDTLNPTELLDRFEAPPLIDYLSLDVEGAERVVLEALDLSKYSIALMSIEHNHAATKQAGIRAYLAGFGYQATDLRNDDLFFNLDHLERLTGGRFFNPAFARDRVLNSYVVRA